MFGICCHRLNFATVLRLKKTTAKWLPDNENKDQLSLTNPRDALHHRERAANK